MAELIILKEVTFCGKPWSIGLDGRENDCPEFIADAVAAMERLIDNYGDAGGEFLFDANYLIGQAKEKNKDFQSAALNYETALNNSSGMQMRMTLA